MVDKGAEGRLMPAHPPDVVDEHGDIRYGWTGAVPMFDGETIAGTATIVARATPEADDTVRLVSRLAVGPPGTHVVVVADPDAALPGNIGGAEVIRVGETATAAVALAIAIRRAQGEFIVVGESWPGEATPDRIPGLVAALADVRVGVAGWWGVAAAGIPRFAQSAALATSGVVAVAWPGLTFRTTDGTSRGPVDESFRDADMLATWWSLVLRDEGSDSPPRRAVSLLDQTGPPAVDASRDPASRRDRYRILDRFGRRNDLLTDPI